MIPQKKIEIFCGTGGVGKTTIATSRALSLCLKGRKVLLITIDPSRRLKQVLGLTSIGDIHKVESNTFDENNNGQSFDALLMSPESTMKWLLSSHPNLLEKNNFIVKTLTSPYGGMNEILSIVELQRHFDSQKYDTIVLDTPPGDHFIDFLKSCEKINNFFSSQIIEAIKNVSGKSSKKFSIVKKVISGGMNKLLSYLEKVTGSEFIDEFLDAISLVYSLKTQFVKAIELESALKNPQTCNWFLVTSAEHSKTHEAIKMKQEAVTVIHNDSYFILNKTLPESFLKWAPSNDFAQQLKDSLVTKQKNIEKFLTEKKLKILSFQDIISSKTELQIRELAESFKNKDNT